MKWVVSSSLMWILFSMFPSVKIYEVLHLSLSLEKSSLLGKLERKVVVIPIFSWWYTETTIMVAVLVLYKVLFVYSNNQ